MRYKHFVRIMVRASINCVRGEHLARAKSDQTSFIVGKTGLCLWQRKGFLKANWSVRVETFFTMGIEHWKAGSE
jgi:hypothetical protein